MAALLNNGAFDKIIDLTAESGDSEPDIENGTWDTQHTLRNVWGVHQRRPDGPVMQHSKQSSNNNSPLPTSSEERSQPPARKRQRTEQDARSACSPGWRPLAARPQPPQSTPPASGVSHAPNKPFTISPTYMSEPRRHVTVSTPNTAWHMAEPPHGLTWKRVGPVPIGYLPMTSSNTPYMSLADMLRADQSKANQVHLGPSNLGSETIPASQPSEPTIRNSNSSPENYTVPYSPQQDAEAAAQSHAKVLPSTTTDPHGPLPRDASSENKLAKLTYDGTQLESHRKILPAAKTSTSTILDVQTHPSQTAVNGSSTTQAHQPPEAASSKPSGQILFQYPPETPNLTTFTRYRRNAMQVLNNLEALTTTERSDALVEAVNRKRDPDTMHWTPEEHALLMHAKEELQLKWAEIHPRFFSFRGRDWHVVQTQYSQFLAIRERGKPAEANKINNSPFVRTRTRIAKQTPDSRDVSSGVEPVSDGPVWDQNNLSDSDEGSTGIYSRQLGTNPDVKGRVTVLKTSSIPSKSRQMRGGLLQNMRQLDEYSRTVAALASGNTKLVPSTHLIHYDPTQLSNSVSRERFQRTKMHRSVSVQRPYLDFHQRQALATSIDRGLWSDAAVEWHNQVLHVDFMEFEIKRLAPFVVDVMGYDEEFKLPLHQSLSDILRHADETLLYKIARHAQSNTGIFNRTSDSLRAFLQDLASGQTNSKASTRRISLSNARDSLAPLPIGSCLRNRELGLKNRNSYSSVGISLGLRANMEDTLGPHLKFTGASGDVNAVAWAPNGDNFAVGSAALTDSHSMQYNARNNLLFGSVDRRTLLELPHHATRRERTESGANSSHSMHVSQDPLLFQSVSAVQFTADGDALISTGFDQFARVWDLRYKDRGPICRWSLKHRAEVDVLAVNSLGLIATGAKTPLRPNVKVYRYKLDDEDTSSMTKFSFHSPKSQQSPGKHIYPTCLRWGNEIHDQQRYLLGGFSAKNEDFGEGEVCLWDVQAAEPTAVARGGRTVFDVAWSPWTFGRFAVGSPPSGGANRGTHSVIRLYDSKLSRGHPNSEMHVSTWATMEMECPARDMNDIVFNPTDEHLISTGCTDGCVYVWDLRRPDRLLHRFEHGPPAIEVDGTADLELTDTGVRFLTWGGTRRSLYTGSSDGAVVNWDPYRSSEDAFLRTVAQLNSGVMSGAFNHDYSSLLLGEVNGSVMVLSVGRDDLTIHECDKFELQSANRKTVDKIYKELDIPNMTTTTDSTSGRGAAKELVDTGKIEFRPFGDLPFRQAVKGPNYDGPFDMTEHSIKLRNEADKFQQRFKRSEVPDSESRRAFSAMTEEEQGDGGHWKQRIPHNLRASRGKQKWPYRVDLCCFRCETALHKPEPVEDLVCCSRCRLTWRVDILGYTLVSSSDNSCLTTSELSKSKDSSLNEMQVDIPELDEDVALLQRLEDEPADLQDIEAHYHNLWQVEHRR